DASGQLTSPVGTAMADLPCEPRAAAVLLAALAAGCAEHAITVVAMTSVQHVCVGWRTGASKQAAAAADDAMRQFVVREGDHLSWLNVYRAFEEHGRNAAWAKEHFLNPAALQRAAEIRNQLRHALVALVARERRRRGEGTGAGGSGGGEGA